MKGFERGLLGGKATRLANRPNKRQLAKIGDGERKRERKKEKRKKGNCKLQETNIAKKKHLKAT